MPLGALWAPIALCRLLLSIFGKHSDKAPVVYFSLASQLLAFVILPFFIRITHARTRRSSTLILVFLPLYMSSYGIWARTHRDNGSKALDPADFWCAGATTILTFLIWGLECFGPEHPSQSYQIVGKEVNESPFQVANVYSRLTFHWMDTLM